MVKLGFWCLWQCPAFWLEAGCRFLHTCWPRLCARQDLHPPAQALHLELTNSSIGCRRSTRPLPAIISNHLQDGCRAAVCGALLDLPLPFLFPCSAPPGYPLAGQALHPQLHLNSSTAAVPAPPDSPLPCSSPAVFCLHAGHALHHQCPCALLNKLLYWTCHKLSLLSAACHRGPPGAGHLPGG